MNSNLRSRVVIHEILLSIKKDFLSYDVAFNKYSNYKDLSVFEKKFIHNTVLTSIRNNLVIKDIIYEYSNKKKLNSNQYLILLSGISQLIFLNIKEHAVIFSMVEISKNNRFKSDPSYINAVLRKVAINKDKLKQKNASYKFLPLWFKKNTKEWNDKTKKDFLSSIRYQPNLHIVFKDANKLKKFNLSGILTTSKSMIIKNHGKINELPNYDKGDWWVQDYSAMLPISLFDNIDDKEVIDMCAAPGGKAFQLLSKKIKTTLYEKNANRAKILEENLKRLKFNTKINIDDANNIDELKKFDIVILDSPCSAVGTIRRNPEILFRDSILDIDHYLSIQKNLLNKASRLVKKDGIILYMVCSFFKLETNKQINMFLKKNKNFSVDFFDIKKNKLINKKGFIKTIPQKIDNDFLIDGFFAAKLIRNE